MEQLILPLPSSLGKFMEIFRDTTKTKVLVFVRFEFFVIALFLEYYASHGFPRYTFKRYLAFAKEAKYLDPYNAKFREGSLQTWP